MDASLWPGEETGDSRFTDGVEEVFLQSDNDSDDDVPLGEIFPGNEKVREGGTWGSESNDVLRRYARDESSMQDANGRSLDLTIDDPENDESE